MNKVEHEKLIEQVAQLVSEAKRIAVFTGAGVSTESGIPDFRSPGGIWERFDPDDFTYEKFTKDASARLRMWQMLREGLLTEAEPNPAHRAIAELDRLGKLECVITQNVDNLHQKAGVPGEKVFELHGSMQRAGCLQCGRRYPISAVRERLLAGETAPDCEACHGILKPDAVFFGEQLPKEALDRATACSYRCDLFIVIGSSLVVYPAAYMPRYAVGSGAKLVIINLSPTPMDHEATVVINAKAGEVMPRVVTKVSERLMALKGNK